jgi:Na+/H+ antiporter NhaA
VKVGVLAGSLIAAAIGATILSIRDRHYKHLER